MRKIIICLYFVSIAVSLNAQGDRDILLNQPDLSRGLAVMKALSLRASATDYDTTSFKLQDLSDLVWAANGINRQESAKRTAPSAMNSQEINVYVLMKSGAYLYDAKMQRLVLITAGDYRLLAAGKQVDVARAPVNCVLVSDISRFKTGDEPSKLLWAAMDAGIVSQNIAVFCAGVGFSTRPRVTMDQQKLSEVLKLKASQHLMLNHPVSYKKE
jgi:SagB-type dehydrogenase family enzyme